MEELNKNQIVLLTLLVSFVTSIATGIVTVTLMDQAPPQVTQTINRIVERTIEKAVPGETKIETVVKEVPIVVTEDKLIVEVINNTSPGAVRITDSEGQTLGTGFIVNVNGLVATAANLLPAGSSGAEDATSRSGRNSRNNNTEDPKYQIYVGNMEVFPATIIRTSTTTDVALLQMDLGTLVSVSQIAGTGGAGFRTPLVLTLDSTEALPGQTVVALGLPDQGPINISGGLVSSVVTDESGTDLIRTTAANVSNIGGPILSTKGKVLGLSREVGVAVTSKMISQAIASISQPSS